MKEKIKEFMIGTLGTFGLVVYNIFAIALWLLTILPIYFLDLPYWATFVLCLIALVPFVGDIMLLILWCITLPTIAYEPTPAIVLYCIGLAVFAIEYVIPLAINIVVFVISSIANIFRR